MNSWGTLPTGSGATAYPETPRQTTRTQSGAQQRPGDWEQVDQLMTLRPGPAGAGGASAPMSLAGVTNLRVSIPAAAFGLRVWEDPRRIGGVDLRYWLLRRLHTRSHEIHTVAGLVEQLHAAGFTVRGRVSKTVSDALATETSKGRIVRTGWGRYRAGLPIPKTTWWRVCNRTGVLQRRLEKQLHQIAERYFHHWRSHAPIPADRVAKLWKNVGGPYPHIRIRLAPRTLSASVPSSGRTKVAAGRNSTQEKPSSSTHTPRQDTVHSRWTRKRPPPARQPQPQAERTPIERTPLKVHRLMDLTPPRDAANLNNSGPWLVLDFQLAWTARATSPHLLSAAGFWRSSSSSR